MKPFALCLLALATLSSLRAQEGNLTIEPPIIADNTASSIEAIVDLTAYPAGSVIPNSVNLIRITAAGQSIVATMRDDGTNGDHLPNDRIFYAKVSIHPQGAPSVQFSVSLARYGQLRRTTIGPAQVMTYRQVGLPAVSVVGAQSTTVDLPGAASFRFPSGSFLAPSTISVVQIGHALFDTQVPSAPVVPLRAFAPVRMETSELPAVPFTVEMLGGGSQIALGATEQVLGQLVVPDEGLSSFVGTINIPASLCRAATAVCVVVEPGRLFQVNPYVLFLRVVLASGTPPITVAHEVSPPSSSQIVTPGESLQIRYRGELINAFTTTPLADVTITSFFTNRCKHTHDKKKVFTPSTLPCPEGYRLKPHYGIDLRASVGTDVFAPAGGRVSADGCDDAYGGGQFLNINHADLLLTRYLHLSWKGVKASDPVDASKVIAKSGNTKNCSSPPLTWDPHLHYAVHVEGLPTDPEPFVSTNLGLFDPLELRLFIEDGHQSHSLTAVRVTGMSPSAIPLDFAYSIPSERLNAHCSAKPCRVVLLLTSGPSTPVGFTRLMTTVARWIVHVEASLPTCPAQTVCGTVTDLETGTVMLQWIVLELRSAAGAVLRTTTTDAAGKYQFGSLTAPNYFVAPVVLPGEFAVPSYRFVVPGGSPADFSIGGVRARVHILGPSGAFVLFTLQPHSGPPPCLGPGCPPGTPVSISGVAPWEFSIPNGTWWLTCYVPPSWGQTSSQQLVLAPQQRISASCPP